MTRPVRAPRAKPPTDDPLHASGTPAVGTGHDRMLELQRAAGNAAVVQALASVTGDPLSLQRAPNPALEAGAKLAAIEERRKAGAPIADDEQMHTEATAINAAEALAAKAHGSHAGTEVADISGSLHNHITIIEAARARGYLQAIGDLSAKGMDKTADYGAFGRSMLGNLMWALSAVIPALPAFAAAGESIALVGLRTYLSSMARRLPSLRQATIVGTAGAMLAQFSSGLPSSTSSSARKIMLENTLTAINSARCNEMRREVPEYLANAVGAAPPSAGDDIAEYRAELEMGLRYLLYGDVYRSHLNDGELPDAAKIQDNARNQLLRQYVVANSALDDGELAPTRATEGNVEIDAAVDLLGGKERFAIEPYELVINQMRSAATDMGATISFDATEVPVKLAKGDYYLPVSSYDRNALFSYDRGWQRLFDKKVIRPDPGFDNEYYLGGLKSVEWLIVRHDDLDSTVVNGKTIYSAKAIYFDTIGPGKVVSSGVGVIDPPDQLRIRYRVEP